MSTLSERIAAAEQAAIDDARPPRKCPTCRLGFIHDDAIQCQNCLAVGARIYPNQKYEEHR